MREEKIMHERHMERNGIIIDDSDDPKTSAGFIAGTYRLSKKIAALLEKLSNQLAELGTNFEPPKRYAYKEHGPEQIPLPGFADEPWTPPEIEAKKPREWCNTVKVYDWLVENYEEPFTLMDMYVHADGITEATFGKVGMASYSRILSTLRRAGAVTFDKEAGKYHLILSSDMDKLREAIERVAKKRKEVAA